MHATAQGLETKLGDLITPHAYVGNISSYYVDTYGFQPSTQLVAWSGDNPNSVAGLGLEEGDVAVSMGTSDTLFGITTTPTPAKEGHVFVNPVDPCPYGFILILIISLYGRPRLCESSRS